MHLRASHRRDGRHRRRLFVLAAGAFLVLPLAVAAEPPRHERPSLEGFGGLLATPSAFVQPPGTAHLVYTNAEDPRFRDRPRTRTYVASFGLVEWLEVAGRVTDVADGPRDLSLNAKLRLPLELLAPRLPLAVAVGTQDEGGAASHFRTRYAVASARLWRLSASAGYGTGPDRLDGAFGGLAFRALDPVELLADWDTADVNAGVRLSVPLDRVGLPLRLGGIARAAVTHEPLTVEWAATLEVPLWWNVDPRSGRKPVFSDGARPPPTPAAASDDVALRALEDALVTLGLEEVRAGRDGELLVVEYENNRFNHSEADGLDVVLGEIERAGLGGEPAAVVVKRSGLRLVEIGVPAGVAPRGAAVRSARFSWHPPPRRAAWASRAPRNRRLLHSQLVIGPGLRTFVATELGVLDALVSLRPDAIVALWPGATFFARADVPLYWTDDLEDGKLLRRYREDARLEYAALHQAFPVARGVTAMIGGGVFRGTDVGGLGEVLWTPGDGSLALGVQASWSADEDRVEHRAATASARWRYDPLDVVAQVRGGRFFAGDEGATVELSRWFGDLQVGFFFTRTEASLAGGFVTLPLTFRRDMRPGHFPQLRGPRRFGHDISTVVGEERNEITVGLAIPPLSPWNLDAVHYDAGRLSRDGTLAALPAR